MKAFDHIHFPVLLKKLITFSFTENTVTVMISYLLGSRQFVSYNGFNSKWYDPTTGVPQGSNLAPLLFIIFVDES